MANIIAQADAPGIAAVSAESTQFNALRGLCHAAEHGAVAGINDNPSNQAGPGIYGESRGTGVWGTSKTWHGVFGVTESVTGGAGVHGQSDTGEGVRGQTKAPGHGAVVGVNENSSDQAGPGVYGESRGSGVWGKSKTWHGVCGMSDSTTGGAGVCGIHTVGVGVLGQSESGEGVRGESNSTGCAAVAGYALNPDGNGAAIWGESRGKGPAGYFKGNVFVTGDVSLVNADCAEDFDVCGAQDAEPGTVVVLGEAGAVRPSVAAYDKRVAGVVSGAGEYKPGIVLDKQETGRLRAPVALMGKVFCKADARFGSVEVGDLLTTSPTTGHAMKAGDHFRAFGAVLGKALGPLPAGQGLIPVLVSLQ